MQTFGLEYACTGSLSFKPAEKDSDTKKQPQTCRMNIFWDGFWDDE